MMKAFHVSVKSVITKGNKVLMVKRLMGDGDMAWDFPGGRMDDDETVIETLHRELHEEMVSIKNYSVGELLHAARSYRYDKDGIGLLTLFYEIEAEEFDVDLSDEHLEYAWFDVGELEKISHDTTIVLNKDFVYAAKKSLSN